ncbi:MAG: succinoglycan biosynthesis transport protein ExoP [Planctomycetota bacterium]|jgi:succinoglycan biosynthesis transport protein ExoP
MPIFRKNPQAYAPFATAPPDEAAEIPATREELAVLNSPQSVIAEQYRRLRNSILTLNPDRASRTILMTSATRGEGKSVATLNLALSLVESPPTRVLVVDADIRDPSVEHYLGIPRRRGITELLRGEIPLKAAVRRTSIKNLDIISAGERSHDPNGVMNLDRIKSVLHTLKREYDYVLLDTPPALALNDPSMLGTISDGIILVVRLGETPRHMVEQAQRILETLGGNILGLCLTGARASKSSAYGSY